MLGYMEEYIVEYKKGPEYSQALENRIALSVLRAVINQTHSNDNLIEGGRHIKVILQSERYIVALSQLNTSNMPFAWKVFFLLAKQKQTFLLLAMLKLIEFLRTHEE